MARIGGKARVCDLVEALTAIAKEHGPDVEVYLMTKTDDGLTWRFAPEFVDYYDKDSEPEYPDGHAEIWSETRA